MEIPPRRLSLSLPPPGQERERLRRLAPHPNLRHSRNEFPPQSWPADQAGVLAAQVFAAVDAVHGKVTHAKLLHHPPAEVLQPGVLAWRLERKAARSKDDNAPPCSPLHHVEQPAPGHTQELQRCFTVSHGRATRILSPESRHRSPAADSASPLPCEPSEDAHPALTAVCRHSVSFRIPLTGPALSHPRTAPGEASRLLPSSHAKSEQRPLHYFCASCNCCTSVPDNARSNTMTSSMAPSQEFPIACPVPSSAPIMKYRPPP